MANDIKEFLAKQVTDRRKKAKLSQAALAKQTGLSIARISEIERAIANPTLDTLEALAGVFNVSVVDLLDYEGSLTSADKVKEKITGTLEKFDEKQLQAVFALVRGVRK
ncbi:helix-turn-helix transcriptional regulator [Desulfovibrio sp. OttesenSCG-928-C14]|nr:helix-turn-helix transcriptional regulator [Desulfovibrio sp. OttesenSCG-928-C14]